MDIASSGPQSNPISSPAELVVPSATPRDVWGRWSATVHGGLVLLTAAVFVSPIWAGSSMPALTRANFLLAGGLLLAIGLGALGLAGSRANRLWSSVFPRRWAPRAWFSRGELLLVLDSLACVLGAWMVLSPAVFALRWPIPGLTSTVLGLGIFLSAEVGQLTELNHQVAVS